MTDHAPVADEIGGLLDDYGPPAPTLLPWLARWSADADLLAVARAAAAQAALAPCRRWPVVADAVAEALAGRAADRGDLLPPLVDVLPQMAAYLGVAQLADLLEKNPRAEALCYAALTHPGPIGPTLRQLAEPWPGILTAAPALSAPPLASLPLLARLVAHGPVDPGFLLGSEAAYLLPYVAAEPSGGELADASAGEVADYLAGENCWYGAALCARITPYLDQGQRAQIADRIPLAPAAWQPLLRELAGHGREPWPSPAAELAAAHPATARLDELAARADSAELDAVCADLAGRILGRYGDPGLERWEADPQREADPPGDGKPVRSLLRPVDDELGQVLLEATPNEYDPAERALARELTARLPAPDEFADGPAPVRRLVGECPESVGVGETFSLLVRIMTMTADGVALKFFPVPPEGSDVLLVAHAPGLRFVSGERTAVHVPHTGDSEPAMFELRADTPGPQRVSVTAWTGGTYLGELRVEVTAEHGRRPGPGRSVSAAIDTEPADGAVSLVVRYDSRQNKYRFEFRDDDNPGEVETSLAYDPGPRVERLVAELDDLAKGRSGYSADQARRKLAGAGLALWQDLIPGPLRDQFWERRRRIRQLTILADKDPVPWELLYPRDRGQEDAGFLVEQFPVMRAVFGRRPTRRLNLRPARFVLPAGAPPEAVSEIDLVRQILDPRQPSDEVVRELDPLLALIDRGDFGLLHFACHNSYDPSGGSSIQLDEALFEPDLLRTASVDQTLARSGPAVFINACRSAGLAARYNQLDGWALGFLNAGAAAFIGSLWAVSDEAAREFAGELYRQLQDGYPLGQAVMEARKAAARGEGDPTWLAYSVYGDPAARTGPPRTLRSEAMEEAP
jgi:hypothetical protein